jgi:hypothetical protein
MKVTSTCRPWFGFHAATSTFKTLRPTTSHKIITTGLLIGKPFEEFLVCAWVVFSRHGFEIGFHMPTLYVGCTCVKWIPPFVFLIGYALGAFGESALPEIIMKSISFGRDGLLKPSKIFEIFMLRRDRPA